MLVSNERQRFKRLRIIGNRQRIQIFLKRGLSHVTPFPLITKQSCKKAFRAYLLEPNQPTLLDTIEDELNCQSRQQDAHDPCNNMHPRYSKQLLNFTG